MERQIHLKIGDIAENKQGLSSQTERRIGQLESALKDEGIVSEGDETTYVVRHDPSLQAGMIGRKIEVEDIYRDADGNLIDTVRQKYTVDY